MRFTQTLSMQSEDVTQQLLVRDEIDFDEFPNDRVLRKKALVLDEKRFVDITIPSALSPTTIDC